uniref:Uncharacterized protein n=1 Tax=Amphimedon queenslandica TaxID=400682 RepID=A0A1X7TXL1_AMPQE
MTIMKKIMIPLLFCKYTVILFKFLLLANFQNFLYLLLHYTGKNRLTRSLEMFPQSLCMELS